MITFAAPVLNWLVVVAALWIARITRKTHQRYLVPGLALIALLLAIESIELGLLAYLAGWNVPVSYDLASVLYVRVLTLLRMGTLLGFWMGVRYSDAPTDEIRTQWDVFVFACIGWKDFASNTNGAASR